MMFAELLFAFAIALVVVLVFTYGLGRPGPWGGLLWFFILVFLAAWAAGVWVGPVGPVAWGVAWVPIVFAAVIVALVVAAASPTEPRSRTTAEEVEPAVTAGAVGALFWILLLVLFGLVALAYTM